jgi:hypothetical protein
LDDVEHGPQRPRREERLACAPGDAHVFLVRARERSHERRLPDACLASDEDHPSDAESRMLEVSVELGRGIASLEEMVVVGA